MFPFIQRVKDALDGLHLDFVSKRVLFARVSLLMVVASWAVFLGVGPNWGIDFTGGTEIHIEFQEEIGIGEVRSALQTLGIPSDAVQEVGSAEEHEFKIRIKDPEFGAADLREQVVGALRAGQGDAWVADWDRDVRFSAEVGARFSVIYQGERMLPEQVRPSLADIPGVQVEEGREDNELVIKLPGLAAQIEREIAGALSSYTFEVTGVDAVGPKVGASLRTQGIAALAATLVLVLIYVGFRFDVAFAPGAVLALVHDVSLTVGVFVLLGKEFNLPIIGALLTIVGYSLNDTIVIYDRIRENRARYRREDLPALINGSLNETLSRTLTTTFTTMLAILPFMIWGTDVIRDFVLAMICGMVFGTYSTIFVAAPMIVVTDRLKPWLTSLMAIDTGDDDDGPPEGFMSEAEKRRRERAKAGDGDGEERTAGE